MHPHGASRGGDQSSNFSSHPHTAVGKCYLHLPAVMSDHPYLRSQPVSAGDKENQTPRQLLVLFMEPDQREPSDQGMGCGILELCSRPSTLSRWVSDSRTDPNRFASLSHRNHCSLTSFCPLGMMTLQVLLPRTLSGCLEVEDQSCAVLGEAPH